ncbi:NusB antitermination factor [Planifilum fulgidum]|jgi:N utilization substance protein B|uniref:Transcription antitermination protein NusB n=1 Tax=Planifilum fulgidum TaxID=201973 RepID=A0A1I2L964_9BACL|nr:transcription antitermination factor NusB [Planifilum fulgidum]MBO2495828.1 transcription antitermination factor NusB [Bacillota bacterium]SFF73636.1 NusB antitermination factor [Planifilum fulgidum]
MSRRVAREKALQALYQSDVRGEEEEGVQSLAEEVSERERPFFWRLVRGVWEKRQVIDPVIGQHLKKGWSLSRLAVVDRSILRMAVYELLFEPEIPYGVTLNEAVELAKTFGDENSGRFVNGVLGGVVKNIETIREQLAAEGS